MPIAPESADRLPTGPTAVAAEDPPALRDSVRLRPAPPATRRKVLMVAPTSFFADYGCHVRILEEARALRDLGQQVTIATYYTGRDVDGLDIRRTLAIPWRRDYAVGSSRHKIGFDALLAARVLPLAARLRPDVVHGHLHEGALIGATLARIIRRPVVFDFQGSMVSEMVDHGFLRSGTRLYGMARGLERRIDHMADAVLTSTVHGARVLCGEFAVPSPRVTALPDHVNVEQFRPGLLGDEERAAERSRLGIGRDRTVVVYLGLLAAYQGTDLLLEAARRVVATRPDVHFLVMGFPGPHVYQARAGALGLAGNTTFPGRIAYEDAPRYLALGDIAVGPKISATEGSGKLLNYMAMGLPVVAFDTAVSREYLGAHGCYAAAGDAAQLAGRLLELVADREGASATGARLRQRAEASFDWRQAGRRLLEVYDTVGVRGASRVVPGEAG